METEISFGSWIKKRRKILDLTQKALADKVSCSPATIEKIEADLRRPSRQLAELLAQALEISAAERALFLKVARSERISDSLAVISPIAEHRRMTNLPVPATPLVGRHSELAGITNLLTSDDCRLLTLVGPGGIGKSRLAIQAAADLQEVFRDGVCFIAFTNTQDANLIDLVIAQTLSLKLSSPTPANQQLISWLRTKEILLILDNFEHLIAGAESLHNLLNHACAVKMLVTSQEPLGVPGEWLFDVQGLPVPREITSAITQNSAITLFLQSARRASSSFSARDSDWPAIVRICRLVEGMPLGIELAAAWVRTLTIQEIQEEIEHDMDFLEANLRGLPERHRSLKTVFEHSWELLSGGEQTVLKQLAVFHGGFTRQAAEQVTGASLPILAALVAKSLVWRMEDGRYDLHEVIRQYAAGYLSADPQSMALQDRHALYYLGLLAAREPDLKSAHQQAALFELSLEVSNIRLAMAWAVKRGMFTSIQSTLRSFALLCDLGDWITQGLSHLEDVVQALNSQPPDPELHKILAMTLTQQGDLLFRQGLFDQAQARFEQSLEILRSSDEPGLRCGPLVFNGVITHLFGDLERAHRLTSEGLACARAAGDCWFEAYAILNLGYIEGLKGNYSQCFEQMLSGIESWRSQGDPRYIALGLNYISTCAITLGRPDQAQEFLQESLALCSQIGDRWGMGTAYRNLGLAALAQGDADQARSLIQKSLDLFTDFTTGWDIARSLNFLGLTLEASRDYQEARHTYRQAIEHALEVNACPLAMDALLGLGRLLAETGDERRAMICFLRVIQDPVSTQETRDAAQDCMEDISFRLSAEQIEQARDEARSLPLPALADMLSQDSTQPPGC